jgi:hypothetical protein
MRRQRFIPIIIIAGLTGCSIPTKSGRLYPVIGIGFVRMDKTDTSRNENAEVERVDIKGVVAAISPAVNGIVVGQFTRQSTSVPINANLTLDCQSNSNGVLSVKTSSAQPTTNNQQNP